MNDDVKKLEPTLRLYEEELRNIEQQREVVENEILGSRARMR